MNNPLILAVEDDVAVGNLISIALESGGYRHLLAKTGQQAISQILTQNPQIILLDLGLPDMDGVQIIKKVRSFCSVPILVISARSEDKDKIQALDAGADDYLTKPFSVQELLARIRTTLRRLSYVNGDAPSQEKSFVNGALRVDFLEGCAYLDEKQLHLTPIEYNLLCLLCKNVGKVLTHTYITRQVWGAAWENNVASLRVYMATLRKKIQADPARPQYIQTHVGVGYRMLRIDD